MNELGVPTAYDPNDGTSAGGFFLPSDIEPTNQTRSDARRTYYDPYCSSPNFNVLVNFQVTQILFDALAPDTGESSSSSNETEYGISGAAGSSTLHATAIEVSLVIFFDLIGADFDSMRQAQLHRDRLYLHAKKSSLLQEQSTHLRSCSCLGLDRQLFLKDATLLWHRTLSASAIIFRTIAWPTSITPVGMRHVYERTC